MPHRFPLLTTKCFVALCAAMLTCVLGAQSRDGGVLFLGYASEGYTADAVRLDIMGADGRFGASAAWEGTSGLPSLEELNRFSSVLVWTDAPPADATELSDRLADYVDAGGRVVITTFWGQEVGLEGRLNTAGYNPLTAPVSDAYSSGTLGDYDANDPLFAGVSSLSVNTFRGDYVWAPEDTFYDAISGARVVGYWDDGRPLAAYSATGQVVNITLFPAVGLFAGDLVEVSGDYAQLFRNALNLPLAPIPEPATCALLAGGGVLGLAVWRRRATRKAT